MPGNVDTEAVTWSTFNYTGGRLVLPESGEENVVSSCARCVVMRLDDDEGNYSRGTTNTRVALSNAGQTVDGERSSCTLITAASRTTEMGITGMADGLEVKAMVPGSVWLPR
ncbi:hypothetical protein BaRGS_00007727 [Batillaria attramentaria]|uniref:Uncharacterized protein n=1 Tax=Batillaria attramentaria TaxID=370345 RepID=A0ABD0LP63_9CAEN